VALPKHFRRVDRWLPEIAERLASVYSELLARISHSTKFCEE
jgi:hypothetical protein